MRISVLCAIGIISSSVSGNSMGWGVCASPAGSVQLTEERVGQRPRPGVASFDWTDDIEDYLDTLCWLTNCYFISTTGTLDDHAASINMSYAAAGIRSGLTEAERLAGIASIDDAAALIEAHPEALSEPVRSAFLDTLESMRSDLATPN
jgi:hypothetical protein